MKKESKLLENDKKLALELLDLYVKDGENVFRVDFYKEISATEFDKERIKVASEIKKLIDDFLVDKISLSDFKRKIDSINKRDNLWGFKGITGQMFFNMVYNTSKKYGILDDLTENLRKCIKLPNDINEAKQKIRVFVDFIENLNKKIKNKKEAPKIKSILYFLSYFWQIQNKEKFPVFYYSLEIVFKELGFLTEKEDLSQYYEEFYNLNEQLRNLFESKLKRKVDFWLVEHVFWHYYNKKFRIQKKITKHTEEEKRLIITDEYIPPVLSDYIAVSFGDEKIKEKYPNKEIEDVFEEKTATLFRMMKFEVEKLGRGKRGPDGIAKAKQYHYAIIYDCKSRKDGYSIGTDERAIIEYIESKKKDIKREGMNKIYYLIISSDFRNVNEKNIRQIRIKTGIQSIILIKASQLLEIFKRYLMDPYIDLEDLEKVFAKDGTVDNETLFLSFED